MANHVSGMARGRSEKFRIECEGLFGVSCDGLHQSAAGIIVIQVGQTIAGCRCRRIKPVAIDEFQKKLFAVLLNRH